MGRRSRTCPAIASPSRKKKKSATSMRAKFTTERSALRASAVASPTIWSATPAKQGHQPIGQRIEGEGEDRRPHQRREEGRDEEVELVEQEQEDGEEERREELLPRHAGRTLDPRPGDHKRVCALTGRRGIGTEIGFLGMSVGT